MALYRFEAKVISRGGGASSVAASAYRSGHSVMAASAYRAGDRLQNEQTGTVHDFSRKRGVAGSEIMVPDNAPSWMRDRQKLWNAVEQIEKRINSQLARDFIISIPHELSPAQRREVIRDFVKTAFVSKGLPADIAWHSPDRNGGLNHHAHVMTPFRTADRNGLSNNKMRAPAGKHPASVWKQELQDLRVLWADTANRHLERAGLAIRIDHRSLAERGIDRVPEPKQGRLATHVIEKEGRMSKAGNDRRQAAELNARMAAAKAEHARAVSAGVEFGDELAQRGKPAPAIDLPKVMRERQDEQLARQEAGYSQLRAADVAEKLRRELADKAEREAEEGREAKAFVPDREGRGPIKVDRTNDGGLDSAQARYQIALGEHYDPHNPFGSMAHAAGAEHAAFIRGQEALKKEAFAEQDPLKKQILENRIMIQSADYMHITSERLSGISAAIAGYKDAPQAVADRERAEFWLKEGATQREQRNALLDQLREREAPARQQPAAEAERKAPQPQRAAGDQQSVPIQRGPRAPGHDRPQTTPDLDSYLGTAPRRQEPERQPPPRGQQRAPEESRQAPQPQTGRVLTPTSSLDAYLLGPGAGKPADRPADAREQTDARQAAARRGRSRVTTDADRQRIGAQHDQENAALDKNSGKGRGRDGDRGR